MLTTIERRADLEAIPVSFPDPFLVEKLAPYFPRGQEGGTIYYQTLKEAPVAQYNRNTAALADISSTVIAAATTTFACKEVRARISMSYDQVRGYYDQASCDIAMARLAKRAFYLKLEGLCANALLHPTDTALDASTDPVGVIDAAAADLRDKAFGSGRIGLTLSHYNFAALKKNQAIIERMKATGVIVDGLSPRYVTAEQLAAVFGVDEVLVGADISWRHGITTAADKGNCALSVLPSREVDCAEEPQWARTLIFDWDGEAEHYILEEFPNPLNDSINMDAKGLVDFKVLNASMAVPIKLFDVDDSSSSD
ncbi:MAG: hypothetical protein J5746_12200 [Victivallales bacterium]|nr:hypothetical protein [Victivallales bacterium]